MPFIDIIKRLKGFTNTVTVTVNDTIYDRVDSFIILKWFIKLLDIFCH